MGQTPEGKLTVKIVKAVRKRWPAAWAFKVVGNPYQKTGVPDLLICVNGLLVAAEVKDPKAGESLEHAMARATPLQRIQIAAINRAGGISAVVTSPEEAIDLIERGLANRLGLPPDAGSSGEWILPVR